MIYLSEKVAPQARRLILLTGLATTVIFWPSLADPIGFPKMFILLLGTTWILGTIIMQMISAKRVKYAMGQWAYIVFGIGILVAAIATDVRYTAFFGASQRNNGALTYLAMGILAFGATMSFKSADAKSVRLVFLALGGFLTFYGFFQSINQDPIAWNLVYGPVIGTLGNPNFMAAILGTSAIAVLWFVLTTKHRAWQALGILGLIAELYIVRESASAQGLLAFGSGAAILIIAKLWQVNRKIGLGAFALAAVGTIPIVMGILNKGPFASFIYQSSLKNRLDYWNAAWDMFTSHMWLGVGLDRFGEFYGQYSPALQVSYEQTTDNAHSVFLQLLATGGLLLMVPYMLILVILLVTGIRGVFRATGQEQLDIAAIFALWFSMLLVSVISIDNLGVAVWFWILGGVLYGVSHKQIAVQEIKPASKGGRNAKVVRNQSRRVSAESDSYLAPVLSLGLTILMAVLLAPLWGTSAALYKLQGYGIAGVPTDTPTRQSFLAEVDAVAKRRPVNTQTLISVTDLVLQLRETEVALKYATQILEKDPRSIAGNTLTAYAHEFREEFDKAIPYREKQVEFDPWRSRGMMELLRDYIAAKQMGKAEALTTRIQEVYPDSDNAKLAAQLIKDSSSNG